MSIGEGFAYFRWHSLVNPGNTPCPSMIVFGYDWNGQKRPPACHGTWRSKKRNQQHLAETSLPWSPVLNRYMEAK